MDLEDLYSDLTPDMADELADELGVTFKLSASTRAKPTVRVSGSGSGSASGSAGGGLFGGLTSAIRSVQSTASRAQKQAASAVKKAKTTKPSASAIMRLKTPSFHTPASLGVRRVSMTPSAARRIGAYSDPKRAKQIARITRTFRAKTAPKRTMADYLSRGVVGPTIAQTHPSAYRTLACNAGLGGSAGMKLLREIRDMVALSNTRQLATHEHNVLNNELAFRRAVLQKLRGKLRGCR